MSSNAQLLSMSVLSLAVALTGASSAAAKEHKFTVLHAFNDHDAGQGSNPAQGLALDKKGNLYGNTVNEETGNFGLAFKIGADGTYSVLRIYGGDNEGSLPSSDLLPAGKKGFYGVTESGGVGGTGTLYRLTTGGEVSVLQGFDGNGGNGAYPKGALATDKAGNIYGGTSSGGVGGRGVVYQRALDGTSTILASFVSGGAAYQIEGGVTLGSAADGSDASVLYGTTIYGVFQQDNGGTVFKVDIPAKTATILHTFQGSQGDGVNPIATVVEDKAGNLYGTTRYGGGSGGHGIVYKLAADGSYSVLHVFTSNDGRDGEQPMSRLLLTKSGMLYGTTQLGGRPCQQGKICDAGTVFGLKTDGSDYQVLHYFHPPSDGSHLYGDLVEDAKTHTLYGTARYEGPAGGGTVFSVTE